MDQELMDANEKKLIEDKIMNILASPNFSYDNDHALGPNFVFLIFSQLYFLWEKLTYKKLSNFANFNSWMIKFTVKVKLFWEGHKNLRNLPHGFDIYLVNVDCANFCGLLRKAELYIYVLTISKHLAIGAMVNFIVAQFFWVSFSRERKSEIK